MIRILKKLPLILSSVSVCNIIFMSLFFFNQERYPYFVAIALILDFYFLLKSFYIIKDGKISFASFKVSKYIEIFVRFLAFIFSLMTVIFMNGVFSLEDLYSSSDFVIYFFRIYPNLFFIYIIRIAEFYFYFASEYKYEIIAKLSVRTMFSVLLSFSILFFSSYIVFSYFKNNSNESYFSDIAKESEGILSESLKDGYSTEYRASTASDFGESFEIQEIRLRVGKVIYKENGFSENKRYIFQYSIIKTDEFVFVKTDMTKIEAFPAILIYIIISFIIIIPSVIFSRYIMTLQIGRPLEVINKGFSERLFNLNVNTKNLYEGEMKEFSKMYNDEYLPLKYRDIYIRKR